jgi:hypothetical protein
MTVEDFLEKLNSPKTLNGSSYVKVVCPAHSDKEPSLAVKAGDEGVLVKCHGGCTVDDICTAMGIKQADLFYEKQHSTYTGKTYTDYIYKDKSGVPIAKKVRSANEDGSKFFFWKGFAQDGTETKGRPQGSPGIYHADRIEKEIAEGHQLWLLNGEKAVDRARKDLGIKATCFPDGEGNGVPDQVYLDLARAKQIAIVADLDAIGEASATSKAARLIAKGVEVEVYQSATGGLKHDLFDHMEAGLGIEDLVRRKDLEPPKGGIFSTSAINASEVEAKAVDWIFKPFIPRGMISLCTGDPGIGKTLFHEYLAGVISRGETGVFGSTGVKGKVLLYLAEDPVEYVTVPRLQAFSVDLDQITILGDAVPFDAVHLDQFEQFLAHNEFVWAVIDPITTFIEAATKKGGRDAISAREIMNRLKQIAERTHTGITCLRHKRKGNMATGGGPALYEGYGGIEITGGARAEFHMSASSEYLSEGQCAIIEQVKNNLAPIGARHRFTTRIVGVSDTGIDLFRGVVDLAGTDEKPRTAKDLGNICRQIIMHNCTGKFASHSDLEKAFRANAAPVEQLPLVLKVLRDEGWDVTTQKSGSQNHYRVEATGMM